ncbi:lysozyme [Solirubrobacter sp. CPCC 204708]|uniref:Lysozyme n=1 Tax=Solirubrobacter deserti TaxID=2282478 RepID=A0ABT4RM22_9ACTN|nr:glycoside hydrolase family protein [Solirubrobacter deserti]MBE2314470.1 lysozyme [Solirubrobacter deserti]MDA0139617.1 lysozyme [Solirubrobacter deserti]
MRTSTVGVALIKEFEGFPYNGRPYQDMVKVWTIGYGHTKGVGPGTKPLTEAQASRLLQQDLDEHYAPAVLNLGLPLEQNQFDALVSFVYNCGPGALAPSTTIGRELRARRWQAAADALLMWDKAGGRRVAGLTRRRHAERALFLDDIDPLEGYTEHEKAWIREYDELRRADTDLERRRELREKMRAQRKRIWRAAQPAEKGGDGQGWEHAHRRSRYRSLKARSS